MFSLFSLFSLVEFYLLFLFAYLCIYMHLWGVLSVFVHLQDDYLVLDCGFVILSLMLMYGSTNWFLALVLTPGVCRAKTELGGLETGGLPALCL